MLKSWDPARTLHFGLFYTDNLLVLLSWQTPHPFIQITITCYIAYGMYYVICTGTPYGYMSYGTWPSGMHFLSSGMPFWKGQIRWFKFLCNIVPTWLNISFSFLNIILYLKLEVNSVIKWWNKKKMKCLCGAWGLTTLVGIPAASDSTATCDKAMIPTCVVRPHTPLTHLIFS